jgi:hypothetical protein
VCGRRGPGPRDKRDCSLPGAQGTTLLSLCKQANQQANKRGTPRALTTQGPGWWAQAGVAGARLWAGVDGAVRPCGPVCPVALWPLRRCHENRFGWAPLSLVIGLLQRLPARVFAAVPPPQRNPINPFVPRLPSPRSLGKKSECERSLCCRWPWLRSVSRGFKGEKGQDKGRAPGPFSLFPSLFHS